MKEITPKEPAVETEFFNFFKGAENVLAPMDGNLFDWDKAVLTVREHLSDAMNVRNLAFLFGSGCSSFQTPDGQVGIPTMTPMAKKFITTTGTDENDVFPTATERSILKETLGLNFILEEYEKNIERLMEVLYSYQFVLKRSCNPKLRSTLDTINTVIKKVTKYIQKECMDGQNDNTVCELYQSFYRKLVYRDRALPRPWIFTTNYDLFNEIALDRLSIPYCNGFLGAIERRFNPAVFRYSLAEQLDISSRKWTTVDSYVYLCKLHGSINWIEEDIGLFPIREMQNTRPGEGSVMIYPTPAKQSASFGSPYSDLFRKFQSRIVREQSVLIVLGYGFGDEHINNMIFQALTIPTFRLIAFVSTLSEGVTKKLKELRDPRIWLISGERSACRRKAHHFDVFVNQLMPELPGNEIDTAIEKVVRNLIDQPGKSGAEDKSDAN